MSRIPDSSVIFADLRSKVDSNFWQTVLKTPISQLGSKLESAQQETFRCQHEMLEQISEKQSQFTTGIKTGAEYFRQKQHIQSRLSGLTNLHKSFTTSLSKEQFVNLGSQVTPKRDPPSAEAPWPKLLTKPPKTLEDLEQLSNLSQALYQRAKHSHPDDSPLLAKNAEHLRARTADLTRKHLPTCLARALAPLSISAQHWPTSREQLERVWTIINKLPDTPEKADVFAALLLHKTCSNTIGQCAEGPALAGQYCAALDNLVGSAQLVVWVVAQLNQLTGDGAPVSLHPSIVIELQERVCFLVGQLAKESKLVSPSIVPPLMAPSQLEQVLRDCFKVQVLEVLSIARAQHRDWTSVSSETQERTQGYLNFLVSQYKRVLGNCYENAVQDIQLIIDEITENTSSGAGWINLWTQATQNALNQPEVLDSVIKNSKYEESAQEEEEDTGTHVILDEDDEDEEN